MAIEPKPGDWAVTRSSFGDPQNVPRQIARTTATRFYYEFNGRERYRDRTQLLAVAPDEATALRIIDQLRESFAILGEERRRAYARHEDRVAKIVGAS